MKFIGVRQNLEEEKGFWNVHWDIRPHIGTTKSNIQAVDKHLIKKKEFLISAAVKEVNNKYVCYVKYYESEEKKLIIVKENKNIARIAKRCQENISSVVKV